MRLVDTDTIADFAAEQFVAGYTKQLALGIKQCVFDRANRLGYDTASRRARRREKLCIVFIV